MSTMIRAFGRGSAIVVVIFGAYALASAAVRESDAVTWLASLAPGVAALVASASAPRKRLLMGLAMAPVAALVAAVINAVDYWRGGVTDFPGMRGAVSVVEFVLAISAVPALVGSIAGYAMARRLDRKRQLGHEQAS